MTSDEIRIAKEARMTKVARRLNARRERGEKARTWKNRLLLTKNGPGQDGNGRHKALLEKRLREESAWSGAFAGTAQRTAEATTLEGQNETFRH